MIVAIDGPAGSGKSTTARLVAQKLGFKYIDTGATYRAVALAVIRNKIDPNDELAVECLSSEFVAVECKSPCYAIDFKEGKVFLSNEDITQVMRDEEIGKIASLCSTYKGVRENMVALQRKFAGLDESRGSHLPCGLDKSSPYNVVCEGRDIGTVVFPEAEIKIYITASLRERAKRRKKELAEKGVHKAIDDVERDLKLRDSQDSKREHSPLRIPEGAAIIDTTNISIEEEVEAVIKIVMKHFYEAKV